MLEDTPEVKEPETPEELAQAALAMEAEAKAMEDALSAEREAIKAAEKEMERIRLEMQAQLNLMAQQKHQMEVAIWDKQRAARTKRMEADSLMRRKEQAERALIAQAEWALLEDRWDRLTAGAPWREWAKEHQLEGASKITYEGKLILGDTMGLGKTLTALIAIDKIQAATQDATYDNPIEFGSMK